MKPKIIEQKLSSYDALIARDAQAYETPSIDRLARDQRTEAANEAAHIAQAFSEAGLYMQMYRDISGVQVEAYLEKCGFSESVVTYVMQSFNAYMTEQGMPA